MLKKKQPKCVAKKKKSKIIKSKKKVVKESGFIFHDFIHYKSMYIHLKKPITLSLS